jgi:hypothetical protein
MQEPLKYLDSIKVPTTSANEAGIHVSRHMADLSIEEYQAHINTLTDDFFKGCPILTTRKHHHIAFAYLCQNMMKQMDKFGAVDAQLAFTTALDKVLYHLKNNSYIFLEDNIPIESQRNVIDGVSRPQGWKREQAIQYIRDNGKECREAFMQYCVNDLEMSTAGANSYYHIAYEVVFGKKPPAGVRGKKKVEGKVSRRDQAIEVMKADPTIAREAFIQKCVDDLGMTVAGATTYYYAAYQEVHGTAPPKLPRGKASHRK